LRVLVILTVVTADTACVLIVKVPLVAPAGIVNVPIKVALKLSEVILTMAPLGPAAPVRVTVPVEVLVPTTAEGDSVRL